MAVAKEMASSAVVTFVDTVPTEKSLEEERDEFQEEGFVRLQAAQSREFSRDKACFHQQARGQQKNCRQETCSEVRSGHAKNRYQSSWWFQQNSSRVKRPSREWLWRSISASRLRAKKISCSTIRARPRCGDERAMCGLPAWQCSLCLLRSGLVSSLRPFCSVIAPCVSAAQPPVC